MKKLIAAFPLLLCGALSAQTLFYYGEDSVSVQEFVSAYQKNQNGSKTKDALRDYMQLYLGSRLKIREAKARGYDTLPQLVADMNNLRQQILPSYLNNQEALDGLAREAFQRSQKELHLAHIFIGPIGSNEFSLKQKAAEAEAALKSGRSFEEVARVFSSDPAAAQNGGDLGWITVFSLPYELENLAYNTAVGKVSGVYRSAAGFHIFKNLGERKARGRMKASQILLAFPPGATDKDKQAIRLRADSVYNRLMKGDDFGILATALSNDVISAAANGSMPEFGTGQYEAGFENAVFSLSKDGAVTKPFETAYGIHIVRRDALKPVPSNLTEEVLEGLRLRLDGSDRLEGSRRQWIMEQVKGVPMREGGLTQQQLQAYTDSVLDGQRGAKLQQLKESDVLLKIGNNEVKLSDWIAYARTFRFKTDGSGFKPFAQLYNEYIEALRYDYFQQHLEDFNPQFAQQLKEFKEGNLFFEIMQREIWGPSQTDTAGLNAFYQKNVSRYNWKESADVVVFYLSDADFAKTFRSMVQKNPKTWASLVEEYSEKVTADSSRLELAGIPNGTKGAIRAGDITGLQRNELDGSVAFAWVVRKYPGGAGRSFAEARAMVVNDYSAYLEAAWVDALKRKYGVRINEAALGNL